MEAWQEEIEEAITSHSTEIKDWDVLQSQIKADLKKNSKKLALSDINKLMILYNFATLHLKGHSHMSVSLWIVEQWHDGDGTWFAQKVHALAWH